MGDTGEIVASALDEKKIEEVNYTKSIFHAINGKKNLITMHTHPNSLPPSIADFNSCFNHKYATCLVICHNGIVYNYKSSQEVSADLYELYVKKFKNSGNNEVEAQMKALETIKKNHRIGFQEVI